MQIVSLGDNCMKCQILLSGGKKKENVTNASSADSAQRVVMIKAVNY